MPQLSPEQCDVLRRVLRSRRRRIRLRDEFKRFHALKHMRRTGHGPKLQVPGLKERKMSMFLEPVEDLDRVLKQRNMSMLLEPVQAVEDSGCTWETWWNLYGDINQNRLYASPDCSTQELERIRDSDDTPPNNTKPVRLSRFQKWFDRRRKRFDQRNPLGKTSTINHLNQLLVTEDSARRRRRKRHKSGKKRKDHDRHRAAARVTTVAFGTAFTLAAVNLSC